MLGQAHMTSLFENATEGIILTNGQGHIVLANPAAEKMFGYTANE
jgi:PAS domain S-box-containing protein